MAMIGKLEKDIRVVLQFYHFYTNLILTNNLKNISKFQNSIVFIHGPMMIDQILKCLPNLIISNI